MFENDMKDFNYREVDCCYNCRYCHNESFAMEQEELNCYLDEIHKSIDHGFVCDKYEKETEWK